MPENTSPATALVPAAAAPQVHLTGADAAATREQVVTARAELERSRIEIESKRRELEERVEEQRRALQADLDRQRAELAAQMEPLKKQLAQATEVMWTVDLYLGRDEDLTLLRDGTPAPADTPITIRQKVLVMAEESLVLMEHGGTGVDGQNIGPFIDWLLADPTNLDRVLPEPKGVVVLVPTRVKSNSGNAWEDAARNEANTRAAWIIRNGDALWLLETDDKLSIGDRILPHRREFVEVFEQRIFGLAGRGMEPVKPGSDEWFKMEERADARRRHYMRIMLVLQGIADRTTAWQPLPESGMNLLSIGAQDAGQVVLLQDDEDSIQLGDGGETFKDYQARLNKLLRPGLRIIGDWRAEGFRDLEERRSHYGHPRIHPPKIGDRPETNTPHLIEDRRDGGLVIRFARTEAVWRRNVPVPDQPGYVYPYGEVVPTQRASLLVRHTDDWVLPYDLCTVAELERFLASRHERSRHFLSMVPVIRAALAAKRAEAEKEAPFRTFLEQQLVLAGASEQDAPSLVDELTHWWKVAKTWSKPLNGDPEHEGKATREIVAEYRSRQRVARGADAMISLGRGIEGAIAVGYDRGGRWFAYVPSPGAHDAGVFLDVHRLRKDGTVDEPTRWQVLSTRTAAALQIAWSDEAWARWTFGKNPRHYLTEPERAELVDAAVKAAGGRLVSVSETFDPKKPERRTIIVHSWLPEAAPADSEAFDAHDPLSWHYESRKIVVGRAWDVTKTHGGVSLGDEAWPAGRGSSKSFALYSYGNEAGRPWDERGNSWDGVRPRLVRLEAAFLDEIESWAARCRAMHAELRAQQDRARVALQRTIRSIQAAIEQRMTAEARARFDVDYGTGAADLWPDHLERLRLSSPVRSDTLETLVSHGTSEGGSAAGRTLDELAEAWLAGRTSESYTPRRPDLHGFGDVVVPDPTEESDR